MTDDPTGHGGRPPAAHPGRAGPGRVESDGDGAGRGAAGDAPREAAPGRAPSVGEPAPLGYPAAEEPGRPEPAHAPGAGGGPDEGRGGGRSHPVERPEPGAAASGEPAVPEPAVPELAEPDWAALRRRATEAMRHAYAPYSGFPVGAAALVDDGRTVTGCNVENAAYGVALCAECGLVSALVSSGGGRLTAFTCVDRSGEILMPCGRCRQLLWEHGGPTLWMETPGGVRPLADLLPYAFDLGDLRR